MEAAGWREGLEKEIVYKRKFAFFKTICVSETVWLSWYYSKYYIWTNSHRYIADDAHGHTDFVENITEAEYIIRILAGKEYH